MGGMPEETPTPYQGVSPPQLLNPLGWRRSLCSGGACLSGSPVKRWPAPLRP